MGWGRGVGSGNKGCKRAEVVQLEPPDRQTHTHTQRERQEKRRNGVGGGGVMVAELKVARQLRWLS